MPSKTVVDFGAALQSGIEQQIGNLLGGGLGGLTVSNRTATAAAQQQEITLQSMQNMVAQMQGSLGNLANQVITTNWTENLGGFWTTLMPQTYATGQTMTVTYTTPAIQYAYPYPYTIGFMGASETPEQRIAREEQEVKRAAARSAAEKRAEGLMFSILKPEQVRQYRDHGYFETEIDDRVYRIHKRGHSQNVELIVKGRPVAKYCAHPANCYETPVQDTMISQLLALHHDENKFLKTANKTVLYHE